MNESACAKRTPQVSEQVQRLEKAIARMSEVRSSIEDRLSAILQSATPTAGEPDKNKIHVVPLAGELERLTEQINTVSNSMESMLSRIEL